jgi:uncharacterized protein (TIGR02118 family)
MHKIMMLFKKGDRLETFTRRWSDEFVARAEAMPGLRKVTVSWIQGGPTGEVDLLLLHELYFEDAHSARAAMNSSQGQEAGRVLMEIAGEDVVVCFAEHLEESMGEASNTDLADINDTP